MTRKRNYKYFVGDFETTVYENQDSTEVWASAIVPLYTEDVEIYHNVADMWKYILQQKCSCCVYFHNLQFDGAFIMDYFINTLGLEQAYDNEAETFLRAKDMPNKSFAYSINNMGKWYSITVKWNNKIIEFRDSLKLLPFSVKAIGKAFKTKHQKLDMVYEGYRYAGCEITPEEREYIANDVFVVKEALEIMMEEGHNRLTIGSCCLHEYIDLLSEVAYEEYFPSMTDIELTTSKHCLWQISSASKIYANADEYIRKSYRGGWCYVVKGCEGLIYYNGLTADVNSLYPSVMSGESGNKYPVGIPKFWVGNFIPDWADREDRYFFIRIRTRFRIKKGKLPFIQIKGTMQYRGNEYLETSDVRGVDGNYYTRYYDMDGNLQEAIPELTLTCVDYKLMLEHYDLYDTEILDGCAFQTEVGIFDSYINKYKKIKMESKDAKRTLAKLFLNNLYGKMATSTNSSFKTIYMQDGVMHYKTVQEFNKQAGYIPVGSAITSYARYFTITHAQKNYHVNEITGRPFDLNGNHIKGFIYADTDSIHCDLSPSEIIDIRVHETNFLCWKLESCWDKAIFVRQKTYIEHITYTDLQPVEKPYYDVKCAGMGKRCKELFQMSLNNEYPDTDELKDYDDKELDFLSKHRTLLDFKSGLTIPSDLTPKRIKGGVLLVKSDYTMR